MDKLTVKNVSDDELRLNSGLVMFPGKVLELTLRHTNDEKLKDAYREGKIKVLDGEIELEAADYTSISWQTLTSDIEAGKYDDELRVIIEKDHRDSVIDAAKERLENI